MVKESKGSGLGEGAIPFSYENRKSRGYLDQILLVIAIEVGGKQDSPGARISLWLGEHHGGDRLMNFHRSEARA